MPDLRLLLIDATPIYGPAATSALKRVYMGDWDRRALLHLLAAGEAGTPAAGVRGEIARPIKPGGDFIGPLIEGFRPQVLLYRPVADHPALHRSAMEALRRMEAPLVLWLMDDWPMRLKETDPAQFAEMDRDLRWLFDRSSLNWAISEPMAGAYAERYGAAFEVMRNGVAPGDWPLRRTDGQGPALIRYAGSLAPDTAREAVRAAALAVSKLAGEGLGLAMEIRTQQTWLDAYAGDYAGLSNIRIERAVMTDEAYRQWLGEADILLMAYNFDADTKRYLQYSFANKTPETLASGAAVLAYGPRGLATIDYLAEAGDIAELVTREDPALLESAIRRLAEDEGRRRRLAEAARAHAFSAFDMDAARDRFVAGLEQAAAPRRPEGAPRLDAGDVMDAMTVGKSAYRKAVDGLKERLPETAARLRRLATVLRR